MSPRWHAYALQILAGCGNRSARGEDVPGGNFKAVRGMSDRVATGALRLMCPPLGLWSEGDLRHFVDLYMRAWVNACTNHSTHGVTSMGGGVRAMP